MLEFEKTFNALLKNFDYRKTCIVEKPWPQSYQPKIPTKLSAFCTDFEIFEIAT
jgi:hypothetical protein